MTGRNAQTNLKTYGAPEVAAHYAALNYLTACERMLFQAYVPAGCDILDLGVGGGRTTPYLANRASRYVGVDYCRGNGQSVPGKVSLPGISGRGCLPNASSDVVVFAFNGIDYVLPDEARRRCFEHVHRVLKHGGVFIFSSHNPRAVLVSRSWSRERLQRIAQKLSAGVRVFYWILLVILTAARSVLA